MTGSEKGNSKGVNTILGQRRNGQWTVEGVSGGTTSHSRTRPILYNTFDLMTGLSLISFSKLLM